LQKIWFEFILIVDRLEKTVWIVSRKMDRRERRRRARELKKIEEKLLRPKPKGPEEPVGRTSQYFRETKWIVGLIFAGITALITVLTGYEMLQVHVALEPDGLLNPGDPFSTEFSITNESGIFAVHDLTSSCYTIDVETTHHVGVMGIGRTSLRTIPTIEPRASSTIQCPAWIGGYGAGAGDVTKAEIEMDISYRPGWSPLHKNERYPFIGMPDVQKTVHWMHRTPSEQH
jgi:hypothetical protein